MKYNTFIFFLIIFDWHTISTRVT